MRRIIIGDIHGNCSGVLRLLKTTKYVPEKDILIFVGDYIDYFPSSYKSAKSTIRLLSHLQNNYANVFPIMGNHDYEFYCWLRDKYAIIDDEWKSFGIVETLKSYNVSLFDTFIDIKEKIPKTHRHFFESLPLLYTDNEVVVIHGGFASAQDIIDVATKKIPITEYQKYSDIMWDRYFFRFADNKYLGKSAPLPESVMSELDTTYHKYFANRLCIMGHTPVGPLRIGYKVLIDSRKGLFCTIIDNNKISFIGE